MRVLEWIIDRCEGRANAVETPIGFVPTYEDLNWEGLSSLKNNLTSSQIKIKTNGLLKLKATLSYSINLANAYLRH